DTVAGANNRFGKRLPGNAEARRKIVAIRIDQTAGEFCIGQRSNLSRLYGRDGRETGSNVQVHQLVVQLCEGCYAFITHTQVDGQVFCPSPVVLKKKIEGVGAEVIVFRAELD